MRKYSISNITKFVQDFQSNKYAIILSFIIGLFGVGIAHLLHFPIPWLLGSIFITAITSAFIKVKSTADYSIFRLSFIILGVYLGQTFDATIFERFDKLVLVSLLLIVFMFLAVFFTTLYLVKVAKYSLHEGIFATLPGLLSVIVLYLADNYKGRDQKSIVFIHTVRVLVIVTFLPFLFQMLTLENVSQESQISLLSLNLWLSTVIIFSSAFIIGKFCLLIKIPNGGFFGATVTSAVFSHYQLLSHNPPTIFLNLVLLVIGISIGCRFANMTWQLMLKLITHGLMVVIISLSLIVVLASFAYYMFDYDFLFILLSLMPGGNHEVAIIALSYNIDPIFITFMHWLRAVIIASILPLISFVVDKMEKY